MGPADVFRTRGASPVPSTSRGPALVGKDVGFEVGRAWGLCMLQ